MIPRLASALFAACVTAGIVAGPALAQDSAPDGGLRFRHLEFALPYDPLLRSTDPAWAPHHTAHASLEQATDALRAAVPVGMPAGEAARRLRAAGARCRTASPSALECRYDDVQTRGDFLDDVRWTVAVGLDQDRVIGLTVDRTWTRALGN